MFSNTLINLTLLSGRILAGGGDYSSSCSSISEGRDSSCSEQKCRRREVNCNRIVSRIFTKDITPSKPYETPCYDYCEIPYNCFSTTCAHKFTELTYLAIKELVLPSFDLCRPLTCGLKFYRRRKEINAECEIYKLLLHAINTVSPLVFDSYYDAFHSGQYYKCFLILQRLYSSDSELERIIVESIIRRNRDCRKKSISSIYFVDPCTRISTAIDLPGCDCEKRIALYLPRHCLKFEEFISLSFYVDEAILCELDYFIPCGFKRFYYELIKKYFKHFKNLPIEKRILWWLRIKFFVFNCIGYSISYLNSGSKSQVLELLIKTATSENDAFYLAYARSLGIINK